MILRAVFALEDTRTHRAKIEMCVAETISGADHKTSYKLTDLAYERTRMARGVPPEANTEAPVAIESTHSEDMSLASKASRRASLII